MTDQNNRTRSRRRRRNNGKARHDLAERIDLISSSVDHEFEEDEVQTVQIAAPKDLQHYEIGSLGIEVVELADKTLEAQDDLEQFLEGLNSPKYEEVEVEYEEEVEVSVPRSLHNLWLPGLVGPESVTEIATRTRTEKREIEQDIDHSKDMRDRMNAYLQEQAKRAASILNLVRRQIDPHMKNLRKERSSYSGRHYGLLRAQSATEKKAADMVSCLQKAEEMYQQADALDTKKAELLEQVLRCEDFLQDADINAGVMCEDVVYAKMHYQNTLNLLAVYSNLKKLARITLSRVRGDLKQKKMALDLATTSVDLVKLAMHKPKNADEATEIQRLCGVVVKGVNDTTEAYCGEAAKRSTAKLHQDLETGTTAKLHYLEAGNDVSRIIGGNGT